MNGHCEIDIVSAAVAIGQLKLVSDTGWEIQFIV